MFITYWLSIIIFLLLAQNGLADNTNINTDVVNWQGQYFDDGTFHEGMYIFNFTIYDSKYGGNPCYTSQKPLTTDRYGQWSSEQYNISSSCNNTSKNYYLEIKINNEIQPPRRLIKTFNYMRKNTDETTSGTIRIGNGTTIITPDFISANRLAQRDTNNTLNLFNINKNYTTSITNARNKFVIEKIQLYNSLSQYRYGTIEYKIAELEYERNNSKAEIDYSANLSKASVVKYAKELRTQLIPDSNESETCGKECHNKYNTVIISNPNMSSCYIACHNKINEDIQFIDNKSNSDKQEVDNYIDQEISQIISEDNGIRPCYSDKLYCNTTYDRFNVTNLTVTNITILNSTNANVYVCNQLAGYACINWKLLSIKNGVIYG